MERKKINLTTLAVFGLIFIIFGNWFFHFGEISSGDAGFFFNENFQDSARAPLAWEKFRNAGLGGYAVPFNHWFPINVIFLFFGQFTGFGLAERLFWLWPILALSLASSYKFTKVFLGNKREIFLINWIIFFLNSYSLMILKGGQITVAIAYCFLPYVIASLADLFISERIKSKQIAAFFLSLIFLTYFDVRYLYLAIAIGLFYVALGLIFLKEFRQRLSFLFKKKLYYFLGGVFCFFAAQSFWLIPLLIFQKPALPQGYGGSDWLSFLSFSEFSKSLSLLHPNWPEAIFGKTYFLKPEFLIYPLVAFSALFTVSKNSRQTFNLLFFVILGLLGAFLSKGVKPPLGGAYEMFFNKFPGGSLFRDPTKFYLFVSLAYSYLISRVALKLGKSLYIMLLLTILLIVRPAFFGSLGGLFKTTPVPSEYRLLKNFLADQNDFFRVLWVPEKQRFGFSSNNHPAVNSQALVNLISAESQANIDCLGNDRCFDKELLFMQKADAEALLARLSIKYIIVPYDSEEEIFMANREYNSDQRAKVEKFLDGISWLRKVNIDNKFAVYETASYYSQFFGKEGEKIIWERLSPVRYRVKIDKAAEPLSLYFSESYDRFWQARSPNGKIYQALEDGLINRFDLDEMGGAAISVEYLPQKSVDFWAGISAAALLIYIVYFISLKNTL